jgi:hypothetical protein
MDSTQLLIADGLFYNGIKINKNIFAFTSKKLLSKGKDSIIFYNMLYKNIFNTINNYSFNISQNNLTLIPEEDDNSINKILLCACKKYIRGEKNGILLLKLELNKNIKITEKFYDTANYEIYCFCPILKFENDLNILNKENKKITDSKYFLAGGFDYNRKQGSIKLYKINYNNEIFEKTEIEYIQEIEVKKPNNKNINNFRGFKGPITCITQSKVNGNILITCLDGNVYLFSYPTIFRN